MFSHVVKCLFLARSRFFFFASFSSLIFWFKNLIRMKVRVRTYFLTTSVGTDLNWHRICFSVVSITWYWALRPFFPWMAVKTFSKRQTCFRKQSDGIVRPPRESALIHGELLRLRFGMSRVLQPSSGYFCRNLWAKKPATYLRPSVGQSKLGGESKVSASLLDSIPSGRPDQLASSSETFGSSYSGPSETDCRIWNVKVKQS